MEKHAIKLNVLLGEDKMPEHIDWTTSTDGDENAQPAKAFMLSLWDGGEKTALRIDLWTKQMMVDEMTDFVFQTLMTMADSYKRATRYEELSEEIKTFAKTFKKNAYDKMNEDSK